MPSRKRCALLALRDLTHLFEKRSDVITRQVECAKRLRREEEVVVELVVQPAQLACPLVAALLEKIGEDQQRVEIVVRCGRQQMFEG